MPYDTRLQRIFRQFAKLESIALQAGVFQTAIAFLGEESIQPLVRESLRANARTFAEALILVASEAGARELLMQDRAHTQAFWIAYTVRQPMLMRLAQTQEAPRAEGSGLLFDDVATWILEEA